MSSVPFHEAIPRYHQIAQVLRQRLLAGTLAAGKEGLTEHALCAEFGVSRTTIRQALGMLKRDGVLASRRGVGTKVLERERPAPYTRSVGDPLHAALGTRPQILAVVRTLPPPEVREFLRLDEKDAALKIERLHVLGGAPLSLVVSWVPGFLARQFTRAALREKAIYELLWERFRMVQKKSVHTIRVARADETIASHLRIALADPVLHIRSCSHLEDGQPIRWTDNWFREERYQYTAEMLWKKPSAR